jgi:alpha-galactosidase
VRLGYYGRTQHAALFLENRYTDWGNYYPHWTLRNLWMLSKYVPARKLQIEFLNVRRNMEKYGDDPLAPHRSGLLYSASAALFANPLAWMELTGLEEADADGLADLLRRVAPHHRRILSGHILPIGEEPSGTGWTGLQSSAQEAHEGYLLLFRENTEHRTYGFKLWGLQHERLQLNYVAGSAGSDRQIVDKVVASSV